jgi:hypothetical protein
MRLTVIYFKGLLSLCTHSSTTLLTEVLDAFQATKFNAMADFNNTAKTLIFNSKSTAHLPPSYKNA